MKKLHVFCLLLSLLLLGSSAQAWNGWFGWPNTDSFEWEEVNPSAEWASRAGLQVVQKGNSFYLMGGRTPLDPAEVPAPGASQLWSDVWRSRDLGESWELALASGGEDHWSPRAYFEAVTKGSFMYVLGGQNFNVIPNPDPEGPPFITDSEFFNDVWRSRDGVNWTQMTDDAGWAGRAGLSAVVHRGAFYVMGGSFNDDEAIGPGGPARIYFNDVWKSRNGRDWEQVTDGAPWEARAGARVVSKNGYMYLIGGEFGFICQPQPCDPPYFNDVWRSRNGVDWELVNGNAPWSPRPGHVVVVLRNHMVLFGGFGLSEDPADPFAPANPMDVWISRNGEVWEEISGAPWNAGSPADIKYDFDALVARGGPGSRGNAIYTFGGDRETFDFTDPFNYLNVDNDVWKFFLPRGWCDPDGSFTGKNDESVTEVTLGAYPNPFNPATDISFSLPQSDQVELAVYDIAGRLVKSLVRGPMEAGNHSIHWDGRDDHGQGLASGVYFSRLQVGEVVRTDRLVLMK